MANQQQSKQQGGSFVKSKNGTLTRQASTTQRVINQPLEQMNAPAKPASTKKEK